MDIILIEKGVGQGFSLYADWVENHCPVLEYIELLERRYQIQIINLFHQITKTGLPKNKERFRPIGDKIYELKTKSGVRILCFFAGPNLPKSLILTHGFQKSNRKKFERQKNTALNRFREYSSGEINIIKR
jgi:phage-related protein